MGRCSIYWLCSSADEQHHRRAGILNDIGYQVFFFENIDTLVKEVCVKRAQILILGDEWPTDVALRYIQTFANIPDIMGARLLLSNSRNDYALMQAAALEGFRDIIPADMDDAEWLQRFEFATSGAESLLEFHDQLKKFDEKIEIQIPARIVWVSNQNLWIEARSYADVNETINLRGAFPERLGLKGLKVTVTEKQQTNLTYRFSEALIANWQKDAQAKAEKERIGDTMEYLSGIDLGVRPKVFLAIQSPALRTTLLRYIDKRRYEVHTALQKNSLIYEPKYFTPDLVFIEERLTNGEGRQAFLEMIRHLPEHASIVTIGNRYEGTDLKSGSGNRRMRSLRHVPTNLSDLIEKDYLLGINLRKTGNDRKLHFPPHDHPLSYAFVTAEARLQSADYLQFEISSATKIGTYSLIKAQSPRLTQLLGGPAYMKVVESPETKGQTDAPYTFKAHLCNLVEALKNGQGKPKSKNGNSRGNGRS